MSHSENQPGRLRPDSEPITPITLPPELADFLGRAGDFACLTNATDHGTAFVIKAPAFELATLRGTFPVGLRHELYAHPSAPVIRTILSLYDRPQHPLKVESYFNVAEADQRADFAALAGQEELLVLFYDQELVHRLSKRVPYPASDRADIPLILARAELLLGEIAAGEFDFDKAKADVLRHTTL